MGIEWFKLYLNIVLNVFFNILSWISTFFMSKTTKARTVQNSSWPKLNWKQFQQKTNLIDVKSTSNNWKWTSKTSHVYCGRRWKTSAPPQLPKGNLIESAIIYHFRVFHTLSLVGHQTDMNISFDLLESWIATRLSTASDSNRFNGLLLLSISTFSFTVVDGKLN